MKKLSAKGFSVAISILLFAFIFGSGFFLGTTKDSLRGRASAEEPLDLEPFWKVMSILDSKFVSSDGKTLSDEEKLYGAISGLVDAYGDPYTVFFPPIESEEFQTGLSGAFEGIGAEIGIRDEVLTVISPLKDSPAEKAGLRSGDIIVEVDGRSVIGYSVEEAVRIIRGERGTIVTLTVLRDGNSDPLDLNIVRDTILIPTLDIEIKGDVFIISLYNFSATAPTEFRSALREFVRSRKNKLILDLRGNPGGFLEGAVDITSWFLPVGDVIVTEDFGEKRDAKVFRSKGYNIFNDRLKMAVLIDGGSASASEIMAGALKEHGVAQLVGENTFGKGSVQELVDVTDNTSLKVTIARWLTPEGNSISNGGLGPDFEVEFTSGDVENGIDPQLEKAIEILR